MNGVLGGGEALVAGGLAGGVADTTTTYVTLVFKF